MSDRSSAIGGLHHVTAVCGAPQRNLDFYTGTLEQRLVKRTVNFDDPGTYHLYYGDRDAAPGSILTFFPFVGAAPGRAGTGMATAFAYRVPAGALAEWQSRFPDAQPFERFGERGLALADPDGLRVELVEAEDATAIDGFHGVTLCVAEAEPTLAVLRDVFGYRVEGEEASKAPDGGTARRMRLVSAAAERAAVVDVLCPDEPVPGRPGTGTVHHVAFRARDHEEHRQWRERVREAGHGVTPVIDRQYFNAIYFREPGGILFEIATDPPGFAVDEPADALGTGLMLPPQHEPHRARIEAVLPPLELPTGATAA